MEDTRSTFKGKIGFVLAAAGSAVGLGNLWRFPYLAAKYGGGIFLLVYLLLAVTFGFVLMVTEIAIGRKTQLSPLKAFGVLSKKWGWLGKLATIVPVLIFPYYCLIGGWVTKYAAVMITGQVGEAAKDGYFTDYISTTAPPLFWFMIFIVATTLVIISGVNKGIEKLSRILMPALLVLTVALSIYVITRPGAGEGVKYYLLPDFSSLSVKTFLAALGQLFYSMSLAMGIMITYGSYFSKDEHIEAAARQIEVFDTAIALLAGLMIVPAVFVFSGGDKNALNQGAGLMFITLPKVFNDMPAGNVIGALFFLLVLFAAITSSVSIMEAIVSGLIDEFKLSRGKATALVAIFGIAVGIVCSFGFGIWDRVQIIGFSILDFLDFISNSILLPLVGMLTCVMVGFFIKPDAIISEVELNGEFKMKKFYTAMVKWVAPVFIFAILVSSVLQGFGILNI
ncbi:MAG: sodium-dependent transporter [Ruminococcaceae bacterium]|nr:sodium-dependent transporter [Oscillospiraceae bacterium]